MAARMTAEEDLRVSLRHYIERRLEDLDARYELRFVSAERAVAKAEAIMDSRMYATRDDLKRVEESIQGLRESGAQLSGRIAAFVAVISVVVSALMLVLTRWALP